MMALGDFLKSKQKLKNLYRSVGEQERLLEAGLGEYNHTLQWWLPLILCMIFFVICHTLSTHLIRMVNGLLAILPSLTGFLIASATILISINTKRISSKPKNCKYSYAQIGGAIFFKSIKISIYLLIFAFLTPESAPSSLIAIKCWLIPLVKLLILLFFSKLIVMMLYGLLFLSSAIESND